MTAPDNCHVMAKPTGSNCNIDCKYCFYLEKSKLYPERSQNWRMSDETLEAYIRQTIDAQANDYVQFAWQGGEPTLMGLAFFEKVVELCAKYGEGKHIEHAFQTNGILLNDVWCEFFKKHNFLVGVSIDGPQDLHDHFRVTNSGKPTHAKVIQAIALLKKHKVDFNTLTVVNSENVKYPERVYQYLTEIGATHLQFIPLVERETETSDDSVLKLVQPGEPMGKITDWSVPSLQYGEFLSRIFDYWIRRDVGRVYVNMFDSTLSAWCGQRPGICHLQKTCGHAFALEANGDLYNCDHFVYPEHLLGNIHNISITEMNRSDKAIGFGQAKANDLTQECINCDFKFACNGGCPKHRFAVSESGAPRHNYFCQGYQHFFKHSARCMEGMRNLLNHGHAPSEIMMMIAYQEAGLHLSSNQAVGRNEPCPCGSGNKYKRCCGR